MDRIRLMTIGVSLAMTAYTIGMPAFSAPEQGKKAESKPAEKTDKTANPAWSKPVDEPTDAELKNKKDRLRLKGLRSSIPTVEVTQPPKTQSVLPNNTKSAEIKSITISRPLKPAKTIKKSANPGEVLYDKKKGGREMFIAKPVTAAATQTHKVAVRPVANAGGVFSASLNKGGNQPAYKHGEKMQINVTANQDCNLNIFNFDGHKLVQIFPNDFQKDASVKAGETIEIGGPDSEFDYQASLPKGTKKSDERIFVYAYPTNDAPISVALNHMENAPFRDAEISIEQYRDLINQAKTKGMKQRDIQIVAKKKRTNVEYSPEPNTIEMPFSIVER